MANFNVTEAYGSKVTFSHAALLILAVEKISADKKAGKDVKKKKLAEELSESIQVPKETVQSWITGGCVPESLDIVGKIADFFEVETEQLLVPAAEEDEAGEAEDEQDTFLHIETSPQKFVIREHLTINSAEAEFWTAGRIKNIMQKRLADIGTDALVDKNRIGEVRLTADGETLHFENGVGLDDFKTVMTMFKSAKDIDLYMDYTFLFPDEMFKYLNTLEREELKGITYSIYHLYYESIDLGHLKVYGEINGNFYPGVYIEPKQTEVIPEEAVWDSVFSDISCETDQLEGFENMDQSAISKICHELTDSFDSEDYSPVCEDETGITYYLENPVLNGRKDVEKYIALVGELVRITGDRIHRPANFVEADSSGPRTMHIDFDRQGNATVCIAQP